MMTYIEALRFQRKHTCAVCGTEPQLFILRPGRDEYEVRCIDKEHMGLVRGLSLTEQWRRGGNIPVYIADRIKKKERERGRL